MKTSLQGVRFFFPFSSSMKINLRYGIGYIRSIVNCPLLVEVTVAGRASIVSAVVAIHRDLARPFLYPSGPPSEPAKISMELTETSNELARSSIELAELSLMRLTACLRRRVVLLLRLLAVQVPHHDRRDAEHSARLAVARNTLSLIGRCWATRAVFAMATLSIGRFLILLFSD